MNRTLAVVDPVDPTWAACRFLTCSVLPVRRACNCHCPFCFSKSSISALGRERWEPNDGAVRRYLRWARERGATRFVVTGGGEPLLRPDLSVRLVALGREVFDEVALFTNGARLDAELGGRLADAGLSYLCWSRHHHEDDVNRVLMGEDAPSLDVFVANARPLVIRATCVMTRGGIEHDDDVWAYVEAMRARGVHQLTFKHTYVAYARSVFAASPEDRWAAAHRVERDPFTDVGTIVARLPWGPVVRQLEELSLCHYREPTPAWERANRIARSSNLLSDGSVYASLEDHRSRLFRWTS